MAATNTKTLNFLPIVFRSDTNDKFLSATLDQLVNEPNLTKLYGYIGRKFAPTYKSGDSYITETTNNRKNYQLEPSIVVRNEQKEITFFSSYSDLLSKISHYGGIVNDHSRLFDSEYYSYDPLISFDKLVNFSQYYWLENGPDPVAVNTSGVQLTQTFVVTRDTNNGNYVYSSDGQTIKVLTLARGGIYKFIVDQPGVPFWIQIEPGIDGNITATPTLSSREIVGVDNNGLDVGTITFRVPQLTTQSRFVEMPLVKNIDYAFPLAYENVQNQFVNQFAEKYPQYKSIISNLSDKYLIFVNQELLTNYGEAAWTTPDVIDPLTNTVIPGYDAGTIVPDSKRFGVWQIKTVSVPDQTDFLIKLVQVQDIELDQKVYVSYGITNANKEFYKDYDGFFHTVPLLSSLRDTLYVQDGAEPGIYTIAKIVEFGNWSINVETDILGKSEYTSPNGVKFTSGLKIRFDMDVIPESYQDHEYYVEGVGSAIRLVDVNLLIAPELYKRELAVNYPGQSFPEYITINRSSVDLNAWSRNNRWFHRQVIEDTAKYNNTNPLVDQKLRANRPIIQFEADLKLVNSGLIGKQAIDILDSSIADAFVELQGQQVETAFGIELYDGMRVIFANDFDPEVRNKIYVINLVQYQQDENGLPTGAKHIDLTLADDGFIEVNDTVVVLSGIYKGNQWWYDGTTWKMGQQKTELQQEPLFDVVDTMGRSYTEYPNSAFRGTKIFGYLRPTTGVNDPVLGFPLTYRNLSTQGEIEFQSFFSTDSFEYQNNTIETVTVSSGFLQIIADRNTLVPTNIWKTVPENTKQYQLIGYVANGIDSIFPVDVTPLESTSTPYIKVYHNFKYLTNDQWMFIGNNVSIVSYQSFIADGTSSSYTILDSANIIHGAVIKIDGTTQPTDSFYITGSILTFTFTPTAGSRISISVIQVPPKNDKVDILVYSNEVSEIGAYQVPINLELNAQNIDIKQITLGQMRNHLMACAQNSTKVVGNILGVSNLRDIEIKAQGGTILQNSAPVPHSALFLIDNTSNFIDASRFAQKEYARFKNKFLALSTTLAGVTPTDPVASVDLILTSLAATKNKSFPWYYSDMVPFGTLKNVITRAVFDPFIVDYEITQIFTDLQLSNRAILVYLNSEQLINGTDYSFNLDRPSITLITPLKVDDVITIVEYSNTDGNYIPETPSKLGLWPKFIPEIFFDDTYREPINVLRGHDGSLTPCYGDYRDSFLLELEKRIFNNIKLPDSRSYQNTFAVVPGKFRQGSYSLSEVNQIISRTFLDWLGNNKLDFSSNTIFNSNDAFTWNYSSFVDRIDGSILPGGWRACYRYFYDTMHPHLFPWEMLGFSVKPSWWENYYGPAPYTGSNKYLWDDLEAGRIRSGSRAGIDLQFARPGLSKVIPVDENGNLLPPAAILTSSFNAKYAAASWAVGDYGPVEYAWRASSDFPFAVQQALAVIKPGVYFGTLIDTYNHSYNSVVRQYLMSATNQHITQTAINFNGNATAGVVYRGAGYINWIADYLTNQGISPAAKIIPMLTNYEVKLAYKAAGFTDQRYLQVLAEQVSPASTSDSIVIPDENYKVHLYKSAPVQTLAYSAVIVEKTNTGYSVRGYNLSNPFFTIIPSAINFNNTKIKVMNSTATIYADYQNQKLTVPYGYEFTNQQQIVDFLVSYERYLVGQGFVFDDMDESLAEIRNFKLSAKEFLFWAQQGWKEGSILVLSPVANTLNSISIGAVADGIQNSQYGSKILNQNFTLVKNTEYTVLRTPSNFKVTLTGDANIIGYAEIELVQYEHVLIFDNTTVFKDVIYQPESGNRQYRLKLIGQKTAEWDGSLSAPGFVYNSGKVDLWDQGKDYLKGDLVSYKNQYYTALQKIIASAEFQFAQWKLIDTAQIKTGLLANFSTLNAEGKSYYDSYGEIKDKSQIKQSHALIGFKPRQYLSDLGLTETTQIEFYKGFIRQKGTANAINQMLAAKFDNVSSDIAFYEEWAMRVGEYGAIGSNPFVEIALDEKLFGVSPAIAQFVGKDNSKLGDGLTIFNESQLYKHNLDHDASNHIALNRTAHSDYSNDISTAGYAELGDVDLTIFDLANYKDLDNNLSKMGSGYRIWCAKDFTQNWNIYRVTETNNTIISVTNSLDGYITFTSSKPHNLAVDEVFVVQRFNTEFDGFYKVYKVVSLTELMVAYLGDTTNLTTLDASGLLLKLDSLRFTYMEDARQYMPPHGWQEGEKIWIDIDAETTEKQGQPYSPANIWKVYEKQHPWDLKQPLEKTVSSYATNDGFGTSIKMSADGLSVVVGSPRSGATGSVNVFNSDYKGVFLENYEVNPDASNVAAFGTVVDLATRDNKSILAVGAPASHSNIGKVFVYNTNSTVSNFNRAQVIIGNVSATDDRFGSSLALNRDGTWLYVGAPGNDRVYAYGLDKTVPYTTAIISAPGTTANITLPFVPAITNDANSLLVTGYNKTYIPNVDYTLTGQVLYFAATVPVSDITVTQQPYYKLLTTLQGNAGSNYGSALSSSFDGAQLAVGAPADTVNGKIGTGSIWVYDRVIEAFNTDGGQDFVTSSNIGSVHRVTIDQIEVSDYFIVGTNTVRFVTPPPPNKVLYVEVNKFNLLEKIVGQEPQANAAFGTSLTICSNNCAIYVGAPYFDNGIIYNTGAVFKFHNRGRLYGTNLGTVKNPTFVAGDSIRLDNFEVISSGTTLDSLVNDINSANLLGITALNENGYLRLLSDSTVAKNRLRMLSGKTAGTQTIWERAGMSIFAEMQVITNPYNTSGEYFGSKVKLAENAYMLVIGSSRGTTKTFTTFDNEMTNFDGKSTVVFDDVYSSGSVYTYELYDDPRDAVENPGRYQFCQQLNPRDLNPMDQFGSAFDIEGKYIIISALADDTYAENAGAVYLFENPTFARGWKLIHYQEDQVDLDSVTRMYLYNKESSTILDNLQFIDPAKGKILGQAEQEISYKTEYDPAMYNRGSNPNASINSGLYWGSAQVGKVWWNLQLVRYINYEQDTVLYRSINWGRLFPGSKIEVLEWVNSPVLPSEYVNAGFDGVPKYTDNSAYVEEIYVNPTTNIISTSYYFWVTNKTSLDTNNSTRKLPIQSVQNMIENPRNQGIAYAAVVRNDAVILYNIGERLSAKDVILHIDYQHTINSNIIHSEYELIQQGNPTGLLPSKIVNKMIDSLAGIDASGYVVPDPKLNASNRYGIDIRPRQSMFVNRVAALGELVSYVNDVFSLRPLAKEVDLTELNDQEPLPTIKLGEFNLQIETESELAYIDVRPLDTGYLVLVTNDTTQNGLWVIYQLTNDKTWEVFKVQTYKSGLYWNYVDWYAEGYSSSTKPAYSVDTYVDAMKLPHAAGDVIKINNVGNGEWQLVLATSSETTPFTTVGSQNGTIQLDTMLSNFADNEIGFGNQGYSAHRYDQNPNIEIRSIINAIRNTIFVNTLGGKFNDLFFTMVNYLLTEQPYVDWMFKSSFISVVHQLRTLSQFPSYVRDNQTYYLDYINEVKPYRTKIREYLLNYKGDDEFQGSITDFDLPSYYDTGENNFRSPSGELVAQDEAMWQTFPYNQWYTNRSLIVGSIILSNPGAGYTIPPVVSIIKNIGPGAGATAEAVIDGETGSIIRIDVTNPGSGYITAPIVIINGSCTLPAEASAILVNKQVRSFSTTIKFDRITYTSTVREWAANTTYNAGDVVTYSSANGAETIRQAYLVNANITTSSTFLASDYTVYSAADFDNANDRIIGYYEPTATMPARDLTQLLHGIDYPGVQIQGATFDQTVGYDAPFGTVFDNIDYDSDGAPLLSESAIDTVIRSNYTDAALGTRAEDIVVDGGEYVDRYSSHAPEELIPGIVFDTLDMKVFTTYTVSALVDATIGYRTFNDMLRQPSYSRIADAYSTTLANTLVYGDTTISVTDSSKLFNPIVELNLPGVIFIGTERITYWTNDVETNTLSGIRRGTSGTAAKSVYAAGTSVVDASSAQTIPNTSYGNLIANINVWYNSGITTATDGLGIVQSTTEAAEFLKASPASNYIYSTIVNEIITEDAVNTLTTEDGQVLFEEHR